MAERLKLSILGFALGLVGCLSGHSPSPVEPPTRPAFLKGNLELAQREMAKLSMTERMAQLMMVPLYSKPGETESATQVAEWISMFGIGGVIAMQGDKATTRSNLAHLDSLAIERSGIHLLTAMDAEWGSAMRLPDGLKWPKAMALGAIENLDLVRSSAVLAGQELRDLGIHMDFAPVVDVNSNPANPVIGNRSFGSDPEAVGAHALAWAEGLRESGVLAVAKHFPGHGDADLDSHLALPLILSDSTTLSTVELPPFRTLIHGGVEGVMTAHLSVPALDSTSGLPTSLSPRVVQSLLIDSLGFEGLVITDALGMAGVAEPVPPGTREIKALQAGNDILLFPSRPDLVIDSLSAALGDGRLDTSRVNEACLKILLAKQWASQSNPPKLTGPNQNQLQRELRQAMLTFLGPVRPLRPENSTALVIIGNPASGLEDRIKLALPNSLVVRHGKSQLTESVVLSILDQTRGVDQVLLAFVDESNRPSRRFGLPIGAGDLLEGLERTNVNFGVTLFTSPYALGLLPNLASISWMLAYHEDPLTQVAAAEAWLGEGSALGTLPVDVAPWTSGQGTPTRSFKLPRAQPNSSATAMKVRLDSLSEAALDMEAAPGLRILVVADDSIRYDGCHGHLGDEQKTPVQRHHVYDLASITKVASTTLLTMMAVERGLLDLNAPLSELIPEDPKAPLHPELGRRTIKDLLAHRSGMPAWIPFYLDLIAHDDSTGLGLADADTPMLDWVPLCDDRCMAPAWADTIATRIRSTEPKPPGHYRYSDLGYYLLQDILEHQWKLSMDQLADSLIYAPLNLSRIGFNPLGWTDLQHVAPTELDTLFRKTHVRGTVHDPGAAMMGGVGGHAGLFSDAHDLALLMEVMRKGGSLNGVELIRDETMETFTQRAFPEEDNRRGIGWDKPGLEPNTGASGNAGGWSSFGHSGFTGTLAWTDPEAGWTMVFLSNRICPDAENRKLINEDIRTKALAIVQESLSVPGRFNESQQEAPKPPTPH